MPSLARRQQQIQAIRDTWATSEWWDAPDGAEREWFTRYARACVTRLAGRFRHAVSPVPAGEPAPGFERQAEADRLAEGQRKAGLPL